MDFILIKYVTRKSTSVAFVVNAFFIEPNANLHKVQLRESLVKDDPN